MSAETLVAEALAAEAMAYAEKVTPEFSHPFRDSRYMMLGTLRTSNRVRQDVVDAALLHLAKRVEAAEKEAKHAYGLAAGYATAAKEAEERATSLHAAIGVAFEVAAGCDGPEFERVFSIAHDALESCKGCFPEGGPSRPLVPMIAVEQAEARAKEAEERAAKAEAVLADEREAIRRAAREHWLRVAREKVNAMEYDLQSIRRGHGTVGFYTKGVPQRELRRPSARARIDAAIATDERAKREFPGLIAKTTASIQEAEREIAAENAVGFHVFGGKAPRG